MANTTEEKTFYRDSVWQRQQPSFQKLTAQEKAAKDGHPLYGLPSEGLATGLIKLVLNLDFCAISKRRGKLPPGADGFTSFLTKFCRCDGYLLKPVEHTKLDELAAALSRRRKRNSGRRRDSSVRCGSGPDLKTAMRQNCLKARILPNHIPLGIYRKKYEVDIPRLVGSAEPKKHLV
jgi:hypothetical protein